MQLSPRRVQDDVWVGATGAEIHLRLADPDTCGCSPASCVGYGKGSAIAQIWVWSLPGPAGHLWAAARGFSICLPSSYTRARG